MSIVLEICIDGAHIHTFRPLFQHIIEPLPPYKKHMLEENHVNYLNLRSKTKFVLPVTRHETHTFFVWNLIRFN